MQDDKGEVLAELHKILREEYPIAEHAIVHLEVFQRARSRRAVYELRDVLSHASRVCGEDTTVQEAKDQLTEIRTHLRRASVEPVEFLAEKVWLRVSSIVEKGFWWWPFLLLKKPNRIRLTEIVKERTEIGHLITRGRSLKSSAKAYPVMLEAHRRAQSLLDSLSPTELRSRTWAVLVAFGVLALSSIISHGQDAVPCVKVWAAENPIWFSFVPILLALICAATAIVLFLLARFLVRWLRRKHIIKEVARCLYLYVCSEDIAQAEREEGPNTL